VRKAAPATSPPPRPRQAPQPGRSQGMEGTVATDLALQTTAALKGNPLEQQSLVGRYGGPQYGAPGGPQYGVQGGPQYGAPGGPHYGHPYGAPLGGSPYGAARPVGQFELINAVSNAVKVLPMFYSDTKTVEKARGFWEAFEDNTEGLPDRSRLLVFRQKILGREAERRWGNSSSRTFATLKTRFHNHFLSRTADELWERLQTTHRRHGESVEEWGDRVSDLCDSKDYPDPRMRYQLFRRGLKNKRTLAILDSSPARDIPEACEWLMVKDMHRPAEEENEFEDENATQAKATPPAHVTVTEYPVFELVNALSREVRSFVQQSKQWQNELMQSRQQPRQVIQTVAAIPAPAP
jgi:hypothetical protein